MNIKNIKKENLGKIILKNSGNYIIFENKTSNNLTLILKVKKNIKVKVRLLKTSK